MRVLCWQDVGPGPEAAAGGPASRRGGGHRTHAHRKA